MTPSPQPPTDRPIAPAPTATAAVVGTFADGPLDRPLAVASVAELVATFGAAGTTATAARHFFDEGGRRLYVSRAAGSPGAPSATDLLGAREEKTGLHALDRVEGFGLVFVPEVATLGGAEAAQLFAAAARYCEARRAFYLGELPRPEGESGAAGAIDGALAWLERHPDVRSPNAALYAPRPLAPATGAPAAASGALAGVYARTDLSHGVWKAPAGQEADLRSIADLEAEPSTEQIEALTLGGINPLRRLPSEGIVAWGSRTLAGGEQGTAWASPEWKYVPVRRLALFIEQSLAGGLEWVVFEPNDEPLWSAIRRSAEDFLQDLFRRGAFPAARPQEAYFVRVDRTTITQADIDSGILNVLIGIAPSRPAEFVIIRIQQLAGQERP